MDIRKSGSICISCSPDTVNQRVLLLIALGVAVALLIIGFLLTDSSCKIVTILSAYFISILKLLIESLVCLSALVYGI